MSDNTDYERHLDSIERIERKNTEAIGVRIQAVSFAERVHSNKFINSGLTDGEHAAAILVTAKTIEAFLASGEVPVGSKGRVL